VVSYQESVFPTAFSRSAKNPRRQGCQRRLTLGQYSLGADKAGGAGSDFVFQRLREIAIDHQNGVFSGMNNYVQEIGGRPPMTVEQFVEKHRSEFGE
jgi:hypothetical protein